MGYHASYVQAQSMAMVHQLRKRLSFLKSETNTYYITYAMAIRKNLQRVISYPQNKESMLCSTR